LDALFLINFALKHIYDIFLTTKVLEVIILDITNLEKLAKIRLTEEERKEIEKDLAYFTTMLEDPFKADTSNVQGTTIVSHTENVYRDDLVEDFEDLLFDGEIIVPRIVE
jgi:aspartyl/glutamyl-tRNA(Asn/Gln) amidotransferase C subunit